MSCDWLDEMLPFRVTPPRMAGDHIAEAGGHVVREIEVGTMDGAGRDVDLAKVLRGYQSAVLPHAGANEVAEKAVKDVFVTDRSAHGRHLRTAVCRRSGLQIGIRRDEGGGEKRRGILGLALP